jgi:hypothetical protein
MKARSCGFWAAQSALPRTKNNGAINKTKVGIFQA